LCGLLLLLWIRFFKVTERGSTIGTEIKAGIATFLTMSYILLVNPQILGAAGRWQQQRLATLADLPGIFCGCLSTHAGGKVHDSSTTSFTTLLDAAAATATDEV
jgi:xanthine/uracil/vitamin C permease (AzgA family)